MFRENIAPTALLLTITAIIAGDFLRVSDANDLPQLMCEIHQNEPVLSVSAPSIHVREHRDNKGVVQRHVLQR